MRPLFNSKKIITPQQIKVVEPSAAIKKLPLTVNAKNNEADLTAYIRKNKKTIENQITKNGAILFRDFNVQKSTRFFDVISEIAPDILSYTERSSPRHVISDKVYTSTDHPSDQSIILHSEQSYTYNWPCFICFFCAKKAETGGNTPLADNRNILKRLSPSLIKRFETHGILYQRTYTPGLGVSWQTAFQTEDPKDAESFCRERDIKFIWSKDGKLKTMQYRSAFQIHPITGEKIWFNHALFFHVTSLENDIMTALIDAVGYDNVPTNTFFGNGDAFSQQDIQEMRQAVEAEKYRFDWKLGDVLILDNMLHQHGRDPFTGERKTYTLMARPYQSIRAPIKIQGNMMDNKEATYES